MDITIAEHYVRSHNRLFMLDYDGTLVGFKVDPDLAVPTRRLKRVLAALTADPANTVVIVSGRGRDFLSRHLGDLPLAFVAEHGYQIKDSGAEWVTPRPSPTGWKPTVRALMQPVVTAHAGVQIFEDESKMVLHYHDGAPAAARAAAKLKTQLDPIIEPMGLSSLTGHKILEVRDARIDKGVAARHWLNAKSWDFILAAGDDATDEDMFAALPPEAISIKVRPGQTIARDRLPTPAALLGLLEQLMR